MTTASAKLQQVHGVSTVGGVARALQSGHRASREGEVFMQSTAFKAALALVLGVAFSMTAVPARAQESGVDAARDKAKAAPMNAEASLAYGRALRRAGREADALTELRRGLRVSGGKSELAGRLQWEIARTHIARREFEPALATCRSMAKSPASAAASHVCTAEAHLLWRRGTQAEAEIAALEKTKGGSPDVQYFAKLALGRAHELASRDSQAEAAYRDAVRLIDAHLEGHILLGRLLRRTGRDGTPSLKRAVQLDAHDPVAQLELGRALPLGSAASIAALQASVAERSTNTDALRALAEGLVAAHRLADAKTIVETVLRIAPNDVNTRVISGRLALAEGRPDEAIKEGTAATKLMPNLQPARLLVADGWAKKGEIDLAVEAYQAAFGLDHSDPTPLVNASAACLAARRVTSAKAFARRATKDFDSSATAWTALGDALAADRDVPGAKAAYQRAKRAEGSDGPALDRKLTRLK